MRFKGLIRPALTLLTPNFAANFPLCEAM